MDVGDFGGVVQRRYRAPSLSTILAKTPSRDPIAISHVVVPPTRTEKLLPEAGFTVQVQTGTAVELAELYIGDRPVGLQPQHPGFVRIVDMATSPFADIRTAAEFVQINLTYRTLDELAYEHGSPRPMRLRQTLNVRDPVLHGLASALSTQFSLYGADDQLFVDYVGMSLHAHITRTYGDARMPGLTVGRLSTRQLKTACDRLMDSMASDISLAELAASCGLSLSYFTRAFRHTTGQPPHRWLMGERVKLAKKLLLGPMRIADVAHACGFADQSHLTRAFARIESITPARWRRHFRCAPPRD